MAQSTLIVDCVCYPKIPRETLLTLHMATMYQHLFYLTWRNLRMVFGGTLELLRFPENSWLYVSNTTLEYLEVPLMFVR